MTHEPIHRDETNPPFSPFGGFVAGLLAGAAAVLPLFLIRVTDRRGRDLELIRWLLDRPPLAAAYVAAAIAIPMAVAARYQPKVAVWVGIGVIVGLPSATVVFILVDLSLNPWIFG